MPAECPPTAAIGGTFVGADVRLTSLVLDGQFAFVTGVFDGNNLLRYRAQPDSQCQVTLEVAGGAPSFLAKIDLTTYELSWWAVLADYAGLASDVEAVAASNGTLTVATTHDIGETFGVASTTHGFSWAHVATTPTQIDPMTREAKLAFSEVHGCDADIVSGLSLAARGSGVVMAVSTGKGTCDTSCGMLTANTLEDVVVFDLPGDLACSSPALPFFHDSQPDLAPDVAVVGATNLLLGFRGNDKKGYYKAFGPTPMNSVANADFGALAALAPLGRVHVAGSDSVGLVVGTTKTATTARTVSWRRFDPSSLFTPTMPLSTSSLNADLDTAVGGVAALPQGGFVMVGAVDEGELAANAFGDPWTLDVAGPACNAPDPAASCGDAFLVLLGDDANVVTGERWTASGHQSLTNVVVDPVSSSLVLTGTFQAGLAIGATALDVGQQKGAFLAVRALPTPP